MQRMTRLQVDFLPISQVSGKSFFDNASVSSLSSTVFFRERRLALITVGVQLMIILHKLPGLTDDELVLQFL